MKTWVRWVLRVNTLLWLLVLVAILAACGGGGGGEDEQAGPPDVTTPHADCRAKPEVCR